MPRKRTRSIFAAVSIQEAAEAVSVPRSVIRQAIDAEELVAYAGPGRRIRITINDLQDWIERFWPRVKGRS